MSGNVTFGVLASGSGSNFQAVVDAIARREIAGTVGVVVCNVPHAKVLERAKAAGIATVVVDHRSFQGREAFEGALVRALREHGVEWVILAGFMRILTRTFLDQFPMRVVNIHPSLLPAFPGTHAQRQAFDYGVKVAGCTVHLVDPGTDTGPILAQETVTVDDDDSADTLAAKILAKEHALLPRVLGWIAQGRLHIDETSDGRPRVSFRRQA
jgi:phosphoribosylglycinamide formyltransferase-1